MRPVILLLAHLVYSVSSSRNFTTENKALYFRKDMGKTPEETGKSVQNILTWLQNRYKKTGRKGRGEVQFPDVENLTEEPRPFQTSNYQEKYSPENNYFEPSSTSYQDEYTEPPAEVSSAAPEPAISNEIYPPQIHHLNVECQKDRMTVDIEFNSEFNGIIYSKDHYSNPECRYVVADSHKTRYRFQVLLSSCGTQFINEFQNGGNAFLENVLVIQNEPGIVEIWDSARSLRCLWEGSIKKALTSGLSVVTPSTEVVSFSGDTVTANLQILGGRGPFASAESKPAMIGDLMTMVVTVDGDPEHQVRIGRCIASAGRHEMQLTDEAGCPLRPKLLSAFEYTRHPETNAAVAYAYFRAFKFPDANDLNFDCNVELCKTPCTPCQETSQRYDQQRTKRSAEDSSEINEEKRVRQTMWVSMGDNVATTGSETEVCLTTVTFYGATFVIMFMLLLAIFISAYFYRSSRKFTEFHT